MTSPRSSGLTIFDTHGAVRMIVLPPNATVRVGDAEILIPAGTHKVVGPHDGDYKLLSHDLGDGVSAAERTAAAVENPEDFQPDPDDLTRDQLAEYAHLPWSALSDVLDEWNQRLHGVLSSAHGVGLFLDLLNEHGWQVVRAEASPVPLLPPPTD